MGTGGMTLQLFVTNHSEPREESCMCAHWQEASGSSLRQIQETVPGSLQTVQSYAKQKRQAPHYSKVLFKTKDSTFCSSSALQCISRQNVRYLILHITGNAMPLNSYFSTVYKPVANNLFQDAIW